jgi:putative aldouronate transport system permease protein
LKRRKINSVIVGAGREPIDFLTSTRLIRPLLYITESWKSAGWSAIIYLAAISGIEMEQYEAATIDGANRFQRMIHITFPGMIVTIIVMLILAIGNMMNAGFDQIFNMGNAITRGKIDILDWYIYRVTFQGRTDFGFSTAISLMKALINFAFLMAANRAAKAVTGTGLFI